jgi:hypothetical protein
MNKYLVHNIDMRNHKSFFGKGAIFDLTSNQHGYQDLSSAQVGDVIYVINDKRNVVVGQEITVITKDAVTEKEIEELSLNIKRKELLVIYGKPIERIDSEYTKFVKENNISNSKLNSDTNTMMQGFNVAKF